MHFGLLFHRNSWFFVSLVVLACVGLSAQEAPPPPMHQRLSPTLRLPRPQAPVPTANPAVSQPARIANVPSNQIRQQAPSAPLPQPASQALTSTPPDWPALEAPVPAKVSWDGSQLNVSANNSSLQQTLKEISTATGVKVEGMGSDLRIFGIYGPASARDVLNQLLEGSDYNVLMIGDRGEGTPRQVVLSSKHSVGGAAQGPQDASPQNQPDEEDAQDDPEVEQPPNPNLMHNPMGVFPRQPPNASPGVTPQQMLQQLQQRQQQMQQQQLPQLMPQVQQ